MTVIGTCWFARRETNIAEMSEGQIKITKMKKLVKLNEQAQRFMIAPKKAYHIPELKATVYASSDAEFEEKRQKLLNREQRFNVGGNNRQPVLINDYR